MNYGNRKAFTLIELLVVIAIIAILAAILFPVFAQAKAAAKKTQDLSNTKNQSTAVIMYGSDYDDVFPRMWYKGPAATGSVWGWNTPITWREAVMPYVKNGQASYNDGVNNIKLAEGGIWSTPNKPTGRGVYGANNIIMPGACQWDGAAGANRCDQNDDGTATANAPFPSVSQTALDSPANIATTWTVGINPDWNASGDAPFASWWWFGGAQWPPVFTGATSHEKYDADAVDWPTWAAPRYRYTDGMNNAYGDGHAKFVKKGAFNWCKYVYVKGHVTDWGENWDWLFDPGQPCAAFAR